MPTRKTLLESLRSKCKTTSELEVFAQKHNLPLLSTSNKPDNEKLERQFSWWLDSADKFPQKMVKLSRALDLPTREEAEIEAGLGLAHSVEEANEIAKESNGIAREANEIANKALATAEAATRSSIRANRRSAAATLIAIAASVVSILRTITTQ